MRLDLHHAIRISHLGRDMGGCKTYGGRKTYQRTRSPENFWTPPKELLVCSVVAGGGKRTVRGGGPKPFFGRGVIREVFHPPLFSNPPWRPLTQSLFRLRWRPCRCYASSRKPGTIRHNQNTELGLGSTLRSLHRTFFVAKPKTLFASPAPVVRSP